MFCLNLIFIYRNTEKHLFKTKSEVLIFLDSVRRSPIFIVFLRRSDPAKSQNEMLKTKKKYKNLYSIF